MSTKSAFRLPLAARIFLASALMVAVAVALAAFVTLKQGGRAGAEAVNHSLDAADAAQARLEQLSFEKLDIIAKTITNDADFVRYLATATDDGLGLGEAQLAPSDPSVTAGVDSAATAAPDDRRHGRCDWVLARWREALSSVRSADGDGSGFGRLFDSRRADRCQHR